MATIQLSLPDELAKQASEYGLLEAGVIEAILVEHIRQLRFHRLLSVADQLTAAGDLPMAAEEIQKEVRTVREAQRALRT
jgi:hypothetical protein